MGITEKIYEKLRHELPFRFDKESEIIYGEHGGYHYSIERQRNNQYAMYVSVRLNQALPTVEFLRTLNWHLQGSLAFVLEKKRLRMNFTWNFSAKDTAQRIARAIRYTSEFFRQNGAEDVCEKCGSAEHVKQCCEGGSVRHYCRDCFDKSYQKGTKNMQADQGIMENVPAGIVGAIAGALVGALVIVLVGRIGFVVSFAGVVMGYCTLKGYELLGHKLSTRGVVIGVVIMILMVYLAERADWAIDVVESFRADRYDVSFPDAFIHLHPILSASEATGNFIASLLMVYVFTAVGAWPTVANAWKSQKRYIGTYVLSS